MTVFARLNVYTLSSVKYNPGFDAHLLRRFLCEKRQGKGLHVQASRPWTLTDDLTTHIWALSIPHSVTLVRTTIENVDAPQTNAGIGYGRSEGAAATSFATRIYSEARVGCRHDGLNRVLVLRFPHTDW